MKLYFSPGACSLSPHIALVEAGLEFSIERVDLGQKQTASGKDFRTINPKGYVPALELNDGTVLTEGAVVVQYIADQAPGSALAPAAGTMERYRLAEMLNYLSAEVQKTFTPLFNPAASEDARSAARTALGQRFTYLSGQLEGRDFLMGQQFTVADAYLFTLLGWCQYLKFSLADWPALLAYSARVFARPAVQQAMRNEGLIK